MKTQIDFQSLVDAARTVPSGDNCQPWTFRTDGSHFHATYNDELGRHALNAGNTASYLSLGCLIEILHVAAAAQGFAPQIERNGLSFVAQFKGEAAPHGQLATQIPRRAVDRRNYLGGSFTDDVFREIKNDCSHAKSTSVGFGAQFSKEAVEYFGLCEELVWSDPLTTRDLLHWVRFNQREIESTRDGMPWRSLGINYMDSRVLKLIQTLPALRYVGATTSAGMIAKHVLKQQLRSSAGIIMFATRDREPAALIEVGRLVLRAWLRLTERDYALQPLTVVSMYPFLVHYKIKTEFPMTARFETAFKAAPNLLRATFGYPADAVPVWGFRVGKSTPLPSQLRTLRRHS